MTNIQKAYVGMQCFWGAESTFAKLDGVMVTRVGYAGGTTSAPNYQNIGDHTGMNFKKNFSIFCLQNCFKIKNETFYFRCFSNIIKRNCVFFFYSIFFNIFNQYLRIASII